MGLSSDVDALDENGATRIHIDPIDDETRKRLVLLSRSTPLGEFDEVRSS
jgi:hypothetical protein